MPRLVLALAVCALPLATLARSRQDATPGARPPTLRDTGLYSDWAARTVAPGIRPFSPQYPLWTDGARKSRWIELPAGTRIDAANPDAWEFPVGTRFWKEFAFARRAETRLIERTSDGWQYATYVWNEDETEAPLAPVRGILRGPVIHDGIRHAIPSQSDCKSCHEGSPMRILGFSALQLSVDRDPLAPHAETLPEGAITLKTLIDERLIRNLPEHLLDGAPRIAARSATARAALGYLHGNCAACHTQWGELANLKLSMLYATAAPPSGAPPALATTLGIASRFVPPQWTAETSARVHAGDPDLSVMTFRLGSRNPLAQMPPVGSRIVDTEAVELIRRWIAELSGRHPVQEDR